jgi:hypothetical protein
MPIPQPSFLLALSRGALKTLAVAFALGYLYPHLAAAMLHARLF